MIRNLFRRRQRRTIYILDWEMTWTIWSILIQNIFTLSFTCRLIITESIIRINFIKLHILDSDFHDVVYFFNALYEQIKIWRDRFDLFCVIQFIVEHDFYHHRRMTLNSYFFKRQINDFCSYIHERVAQLCERLLREYKDIFKMMTMNDA